MFRRIPNSQPKAPEVEFPLDLEKLGLFVNESDQLRQINDPEKGFDYFHHAKSIGFYGAGKDGDSTRKRLERLDERRREAMDECIRQVVMGRLEELGMKKFLLPKGVDENEPHSTILISQDFWDRKKVLVLSADSSSHLGIWSTRSISDGSPLNKASMVDIVKQGMASGYAIIIMNPGQSVWDPETKTATTFASWKTKKRGPAAILADHRNTVPANESTEKHAKFVFNSVLNEIGPTAQIDIIACEMAAYGIVCFLDDNWPEWENRIHSFAMAESTHSESTLTNHNFKGFLQRRARNYIVHSAERNLNIIDLRFGCPVFSSETLWSSSIVPNCTDLFMNWLNEAQAHPDTCNPKPSLFNGDILNIDNWPDPDPTPSSSKVWRTNSPECLHSGTQHQDASTATPQ